MTSRPRPYLILFTRDALKSLAALPSKVQVQVRNTIDGLAQDPRPQRCTKLQAADNLWRVYSGNYRVIYTIEDQKIAITVVRIGHRKDVYRGL